MYATWHLYCLSAASGHPTGTLYAWHVMPMHVQVQDTAASCLITLTGHLLHTAGWISSGGD